jgi:hypothetical protein
MIQEQFPPQILGRLYWYRDLMVERRHESLVKFQSDDLSTLGHLERYHQC